MSKFDHLKTSTVNRKKFIADFLTERNTGGEMSFTINGQCMKGTLENGERVTVKRRLPLPGDVIVFVDEYNVVFSHRFLGPGYRSGWGLITKADNTTGLDPVVPWSRYVGCCQIPISMTSRIKAAGSFVHRGIQAGRRRLKRN